MTSSADTRGRRAVLRHARPGHERVGDAPGLVLGRIVAQLVNEAAFAVGEGVGSPADVDAGMVLGVNHPRGPMEWGDEIGPPRCCCCSPALREEYREERYRPAPELVRPPGAASRSVRALRRSGTRVRRLAIAPLAAPSRCSPRPRRQEGLRSRSRADAVPGRGVASAIRADPGPGCRRPAVPGARAVARRPARGGSAAGTTWWRAGVRARWRAPCAAAGSCCTPSRTSGAAAGRPVVDDPLSSRPTPGEPSSRTRPRPAAGHRRAR